MSNAKEPYLKIVEHYVRCFNDHGDNHRGMDWPNMDDLLRRYELMLGVQRSHEPCSLLDFGCGTAILKQYIEDKRYHHIAYSGLDLGTAFLAKAREKFPDTVFYDLDILKDSNRLPMFDYIIMNGVLTEKRELSFDEMWSYTQQLLKTVFAKARKGIAFNVMSKAVDWERDELFHLSADSLIEFMTKELSRHFVLRNDYGLYEYTIYLYKLPWQK